MAKDCVPMHKEYAVTGKITHTKSYYPEKENKDKGKPAEGQKSHGNGGGGK